MSGRRTNATARDALRSLNQNAVLQIVHLEGPISRVEIAARLHLSPAAVTSITAELIDRGLIYEARQAASDGVGRKAILLEVNYDQAFVAGIKVSNVALTLALTNLNAEVQCAQSTALDRTDPDTVIDEIVAAFEHLQEERLIGALGVNLPGIVDCDQGTVRHSPLLGWNQVALGEILEARLGVPVLVENDVNALALAEAWYGHGREHDSFFVLTLGRGVGLGIVINGELYRGPNGGAGEIGHVLLDPDGPETGHARKGTLEAYISDEALVREAKARIPGFAGATLSERSPVDQLVELARQGQEQAVSIYAKAGKTLGRAMSTLVNILAPSLIVLSGEGMRAADFLLPSAEAELKRLSFGDLGERVSLVVDPWGDDAWARGAAGLAASRYLTNAAMSVGGDQQPDQGPKLDVTNI
ncbi:MAG TPA: ROK family transcriptional regulator [Trueperaceae bacterium]